MKKIIPLLLSVLLAFPLVSCTLRLHVNEEFFSFFSFSIEYDEDIDDSSTNSSKESSSKWSEREEDVSESSGDATSGDATSEDVTSSDSSEDELIVPPSLLESGTDLATCAPFLSRAPERYGVKSTIFTQSTVTSDSSSYALKGVFNNKGAYPYQEYQVWTWASLCLKEKYGYAVNLKNKCLTYDVKTENCGLYSSFIVMAPNGQRTNEISFSLEDPSNAYPGITCKALSNGWYRVSIDFSQAYGEHAILLEASEILIMYSNEDCANRDADSIFYMDNMSLDVSR